MEPVQLWGSGTLSKAATITAQKRVNVRFELRNDGDKANLVCIGTSGLTSAVTLTTAPNGPIRGTQDGEHYFYVVAGDTVYRIRADFQQQTTFGTLRTTAGEVSLAVNGTELGIVDGNSGYILSGYDTATSTLTEITDVDFPDGARTICAVGGRFVVEKPNTGEFYVSGSYDGFTWTGLMFATAEQISDSLVAVSEYRGYLVPFGTRSTEAWQVVGALNFPYAPVLNATQNWGLAAVFSRAKVGDALYFLAQSPQGQVQVRRINGWQMETVSDADMDTIINRFSAKSDAVGMGFMDEGHAIYRLTFPSANRTFDYDTTTQIWNEVASGQTAADRHIGHYSLVVNGKVYLTDYRQSNPEIYELSPTTYADDGAVIKRIVRTRHLSKGGNVFTIDELALDMETGVGLQSGQGSDPQLMVRISKDGGRSWGIERWVSIGAPGKTETNVAIRRCGSGKDFVFEFSMTDPVQFVINRAFWKTSMGPQ